MKFLGLALVHGGDYLKWADRHGLEPVGTQCSECGASLLTTIPFADYRFRGLATPNCVCGNKDTPYCFVAAKGSLFDQPAPKPRKKRRKLRLVHGKRKV